MDFVDILQKTLQAAQGSNYKLVAAFAIMLVVMGVRYLAANNKLPAVLESGKAAFLLSLVLGAIMSVATAVSTGVALGGFVGIVSLLLQGMTTGAAASGVYSGVKKLSEPRADVETPPPL